MPYAIRYRRLGARLLVALCLAAAALPTAVDHAWAQSSPPPPEDARYAASSAGQVYYWIGCSAWKELAPQNLIFFRSAKEAEAAGYRPSRTQGCGRRPTTTPTPGADPAPRITPPPAADSGSLNLDALAVCTIRRVVDGDTVVCAEGERVRLLLIDTPERSQKPWGQRATRALETLLPVGTKARVELDVQQTDRYGRVLAYLYRSDGVMANEALLRQGYAVVSVYPPNVKYVERFRAAAEAARRARAGLWATPAFKCLPTDHRRGRCT